MILSDLFKTYFRNRVNGELKKSKKSYYNSYFENCKHDIKKTWDDIKSIINPNRSSKKITQININGNIIDYHLDISNKFNRKRYSCNSYR